MKNLIYHWPSFCQCLLHLRCWLMRDTTIMGFLSDHNRFRLSFVFARLDLIFQWYRTKHRITIKTTKTRTKRRLLNELRWNRFHLSVKIHLFKNYFDIRFFCWQIMFLLLVRKSDTCILSIRHFSENKTRISNRKISPIQIP